MHSSKGTHVISTLVELETFNAVELRVFRKEITPGEALQAARAFEKDVSDGVFGLRPLTEQCFERARQISRQNTAALGTRTADLLHVASALTIGVDYLYTFDRQQRKLAHKVGLKLN